MTKTGIYRHYRGGEYVVLFVAKDSTNCMSARPVVVYKSLTYGTMHVRDEVEFNEKVPPLEQKVDQPLKAVPRFEFVKEVP